MMVAWNYMDLSITFSIIIAEILNGRFRGKLDKTLIKEEDYDEYQKAVRTLYSFAAIVMWIRLLYFFRVFRTTGYYIRMLV